MLDILKNKTNSQNTSSAKNIGEKFQKFKSWHDGLRSESGWQRLQAIGDVIGTIMGI